MKVLIVQNTDWLKRDYVQQHPLADMWTWIAVVPPTHMNREDIFSDCQRFETGVMMCKPLSILPFMRALFGNRRIRNSCSRRRVVFSIGNETIEVKTTPQSVEAINISSHPSKPAIFVTMSAKALLELALGVANPYVAFFTKRIQIRNMRNVPLTPRLFGMPKLTEPWFITLADRM